jgi:uncharacterized protein
MGDMSSEPSMEEILSSIKKIIAEDSGKPLVVPKRHVPSERRMADAVIEPTADPVPSSAPQPEPRVEASEEVLELTESAPETEAVPADGLHDQLVSSSAAVASREALSSLSRMIVKPDVVGSDSLEAMVRDMLRPMLKEWLDAKLPEVVERVVAQEVARISGRVF